MYIYYDIKIFKIKEHIAGVKHRWCKNLLFSTIKLLGQKITHAVLRLTGQTRNLKMRIFFKYITSTHKHWQYKLILEKKVDYT